MAGRSRRRGSVTIRSPLKWNDMPLEPQWYISDAAHKAQFLACGKAQPIPCQRAFGTLHVKGGKEILAQTVIFGKEAAGGYAHCPNACLVIQHKTKGHQRAKAGNPMQTAG